MDYSLYAQKLSYNADLKPLHIEYSSRTIFLQLGLDAVFDFINKPNPLLVTKVISS